jgi:AcrR family transcriptional regulator
VAVPSVATPSCRLRRSAELVKAEVGVSLRSGDANANLRPSSSRSPGHHMREIQRDRMLTAAVEIIEEAGYSQLTVGAVVTRARVSRKTFYDVFVNCEDCFLAVFEQVLSQVGVLVSQAYAREATWCEGVRSALGSLLVRIEDQPALARLWVVQALGAGEEVSRLRAEALAVLAKAIDQGRHVASTKNQPPAIAAEGVVGAVFAVFHVRLLNRCEESFTDLLGPLMYMIVLPYLGPRAASRELNRPIPEPPRDRKAQPPPVRSDPPDGLNMRFTYRTVLVLNAIAEHPGASNREIAENAGVVDQGQISKLLGRLVRLDLIKNHGWGQEKGAANAWHLTPRGAQIVRSAALR